MRPGVTGRQVHELVEDIIWAANEGVHGSLAVARDPRIREILVVSTSSILSLAARGLRADAFGNTRISVFGTLEEALAYARQHAPRG